jgi:uncharacterized protein (TIGR02996 family)
MSAEDDFLRAMLSAPSDSAARLVYADWLEDRGDPRGEFLRIDAEEKPFRDMDPALQHRLRELTATIDPAWLAFVTNLGRPFATMTGGTDYFGCEPAQLPFTEHIGLRGRIMTFASQFHDEDAWESGLPHDLQTLCSLQLSECYYGAGTASVHPFICQLQAKPGPLTGADILKALKARNFRSRHIQSLEATKIPYPGYHPSGGMGVDNDEIHNDFFAQYIFQRPDQENDEDLDESRGVHGLLKRAVVDGQLWYVLLHITPEQSGQFMYSNYVILFAVGKSLAGDRLLGVVTHQVCHNLCD